MVHIWQEMNLPSLINKLCLSEMIPEGVIFGKREKALKSLHMQNNEKDRIMWNPRREYGRNKLKTSQNNGRKGV